MLHVQKSNHCEATKDTSCFGMPALILRLGLYLLHVFAYYKRTVFDSVMQGLFLEVPHIWGLRVGASQVRLEPLWVCHQTRVSQS